ncbi:MAG: FAD-dependent oxidoreductase [Deltaproteobacteria bacterium]|nr:FAD-dependent oxidoreductase [Deltaproteobacteria bacterium]MBW1948955.1 FAD-dependent oxidoreductase [Deltaproteobacteria bacterium]MBW2007126.1 FAD-dependent oxidoreductase [Deltaproteobacteria bacterium]
MEIHTALSKQPAVLLACSTLSTDTNMTGTWRFVRPFHDEKTAPCGAACPAGEDIARIQMLTGRGAFRDAVETILLENPFPATCGRVCFQFCEGACNRASFDDPVGIRYVERFLGDMALAEGWARVPLKEPETPRKAAVIGAGPAGLSAAYFLGLLGWSCEVFEAAREPGGLMRWGIPAYRLSKDVLQREVARILRLGIVIKYGRTVRPQDLARIREEYDAVFVGCGLSRSIRLQIPGEDLALEGLDFLGRIRRGEVDAVSGTAAVIGGGNTAMDVARSLVRLGAEPIIVYRRRREDMPAFEHEIIMALEEGVRLMELVSPLKANRDGEDIILTLQEMRPAGVGPDGRARVAPDGERRQSLRVRSLFTALGSSAAPEWAPPAEQSQQLLRLGHITIRNGPAPLVFGGDLTNETQSVTDAVASGKMAALALDTCLEEGWERIIQSLGRARVGPGPALSMESYLGGARADRNRTVVSFEQLNMDYFQPLQRILPTIQSPEERRAGFSEIEGVYKKEEARAEATRCFNCGICNECDNCRIFCPEVAVEAGSGRRILLDYCKGCGICVVECPRNALSLEEEAS